MPVSALNHFTLRCHASELEGLRDFYTRVLRLQTGPRPDFGFDGYWLYGTGDKPIVHLAANAAGKPGAPAGPFDHISFSTTGLDETRAWLKEQGVAFREAPVPGWPLHQVFLHDPGGLKIELTFDLDREKA